MRKMIGFSLLLLTSINIGAVSTSAIKKYPHVLLTSDYGILTENDLGAFVWGVKARPFTTTSPSGQHNYWQCFPRELVTVTLTDNGHSSDELGRKNNLAYLEINVLVNEHLIHYYEMRANWDIRSSQKRFNKWLQLMNNEKYVCLAGEFTSRSNSSLNGHTQEKYGWTFEKLKTHKGCDSYFYSCKPTYEAYLCEVAEERQLMKQG